MKELAPGYYYLPAGPAGFTGVFKVEAEAKFSWRKTLGHRTHRPFSGQYYPGCRLEVDGRRTTAVWVLLRFGEVAP